MRGGLLNRETILFTVKAPKYTAWYVNDSVRGGPHLGMSVELPQTQQVRESLNSKKMLYRVRITVMVSSLLGELLQSSPCIMVDTGVQSWVEVG